MSEPQQRSDDGDEKLRLPVALPSSDPFTAKLLLLELLEQVEEDPKSLDRMVIVFDDVDGRIHFRWSSQRLADVALLHLALGDGIAAALKGQLPGFTLERDTRADVDEDEDACGQPCPDAVLPFRRLSSDQSDQPGSAPTNPDQSDQPGSVPTNPDQPDQPGSTPTSLEQRGGDGA